MTDAWHPSWTCARAFGSGLDSVATAISGVRTTIADAVATIEFGHEKSNALPARILAELAKAVTAAGQGSDIRVVVLRSAGDGAFCAGASFDELAAIRDERAGTEFFMGFARVILAMTRCPRPIVTRVHGKVVGGGVGLVAASDYAIASSSASVRLSELAIGIGPFVVGPAIERRIGSGAFGPMALDADWRDAHWGERHGLYAQVLATTGELDGAVRDMAARLGGYSPAAIARIKEMTWAETEHWPELLAKRAQMSGSLVLTEAAQKAIQAFKSRAGSS